MDYKNPATSPSNLVTRIATLVIILIFSISSVRSENNENTACSQSLNGSKAILSSLAETKRACDMDERTNFISDKTGAMTPVWQFDLTLFLLKKENANICSSRSDLITAYNEGLDRREQINGHWVVIKSKGPDSDIETYIKNETLPGLRTRAKSISDSYAQFNPKCSERILRVMGEIEATLNGSTKPSQSSANSPVRAAPSSAPGPEAAIERHLPASTVERINSQLSQIDQRVGDFLGLGNADRAQQMKVLMWASEKQAEIIAACCASDPAFEKLLASRRSTFQQARTACLQSGFGTSDCSPTSPEEIGSASSGQSAAAKAALVTPTESKPKQKAPSSAAEANACVNYRDGKIVNDCGFRVNTSFCVYQPQPLQHFNAFDASDAFNCHQRGKEFNGGGLAGINANSMDGLLLFGKKILMFSCKDPQYPVRTKASIEGIFGDCE